MEKLLVALDSSPRAPLVLAAAVDLATKAGAKLLLFRSVYLPADLALAYGSGVDHLLDQMMSDADTELTRLAKGLPPGLSAGVRVAVGHAWQMICAGAREENVDMIVIGSHGYTLWDHLIGTTAARVVNHADRSVLVVRASPPAKSGDELEP